MIVAPHPLDFDWRFAADTVECLAHFLRGHRLLALGTPSVARRLESVGDQVLLIDRQPLQEVENHLVADIRWLPQLDSSFDLAIADPPWYPADVIAWARVGARAVGPGHRVLVSVWPEHARPTAEIELEEVLADLSSWSHVEMTPFKLAYDAPLFETAASQSSTGPLSRSPRIGRLLQMTVTKSPGLMVADADSPTWRRFTVDNYQLALRENGGLWSDTIVAPHPEARGWQWPYVSARAPGLDRIGLWSSAGEVAQVGSSERLLKVLRTAFAAPDAIGFEKALAEAPALLSWLIPRPPYRRLVEWQHQ